VSCCVEGKFSNLLSKVHEEFYSLFIDFKKENNIQLFACPFSVHFETDHLQLGLTDLQRDEGLKELFNSLMCCDILRLWFDSQYTNFKDFGKNRSTHFTSTCNCQQTFILNKLE
jgi:hypothetical protein